MIDAPLLPALIRQLCKAPQAAHIPSDCEWSDAAQRQIARGDKFCSHHQRNEPVDGFATKRRGLLMYFDSSCRAARKELDDHDRMARAAARRASWLAQIPVDEFSTTQAAGYWQIMRPAAFERLKLLTAAGDIKVTGRTKNTHNYRRVK